MELVCARDGSQPTAQLPPRFGEDAVKRLVDGADDCLAVRVAIEGLASVFAANLRHPVCQLPVEPVIQVVVAQTGDEAQHDALFFAAVGGIVQYRVVPNLLLQQPGAGVKEHLAQEGLKRQLDEILHTVDLIVLAALAAANVMADLMEDAA